MKKALNARAWDLIISDYNMRRFSTRAALELVQAMNPDIPFIVISGKIGEERAVEIMRAGAHDFILKSKLQRLNAAVDRELRAAQARQKHRDAEAALRDSEERFRLLSEFAFEGIVILENGRILDTNRKMADMFGAEIPDSIGKSALEFAAPESRELVMKNIASGYDKPYEAIGLKRDGSRFPVEIMGKSIRYDVRKCRVTSMRDLTLQKKAQEALAKSENKFRTLAETTAAAIFIYQGSKNCYINPAAAAITGYSQQ